MNRKLIIIPILAVSILLILAYNTVFNHYGFSFLTVCGTGWWGVGRFLLWIFLFVGALLVIAKIFKSNSESCKCGCQLENDWCNCPQCGADVE